MQARDRGFVITGAGSGLGAATARRLVEAGGSVLLLDRDIAAAQALCDELGDRSIAVRADVTSAADVENALRLFREAFGDLHGAVNCAGVAPAEKVLGRERPHDLDAFARTIQINLVGTFNVLRLAAAEIAKNSAPAAHHRKPVPQRRSDSSGRGDPDDSQVTTEYPLPLTRGTKDMRREGFFE